MNLFKSPPGPTQAPGIQYVGVTDFEVITVFNNIEHTLMTTYLEMKGGDPVTAISVVAAKIGAWMAMTVANNRMREFHASTNNETYIKAYETMGIEIAQDLGILEEYEKTYTERVGDEKRR